MDIYGFTAIDVMRTSCAAELLEFKYYSRRFVTKTGFVSFYQQFRRTVSEHFQMMR
jgi:hypothetical protein